LLLRYGTGCQKSPSLRLHGSRDGKDGEMILDEWEGECTPVSRSKSHRRISTDESVSLSDELEDSCNSGLEKSKRKRLSDSERHGKLSDSGIHLPMTIVV
jgi:hypothetical protein